MLDICLLGTGGMMPLPRRKLTAMMARFNGSSLLADCGEGTQVAIKEKGWSFKSIDVICFTHYHADHISGLPGLLLTIGNTERTEPITIVGPKGAERVVGALRIIAPELPFGLRFVELEGPEETLSLHGYELTAFRVNHNVPCYGYAMKINRAGKFRPEQAIALQIPQNCWNRLQKGETVEMEGKTYTPDMVLGPTRKGIKVVYCTDTRPTDAIAAHAQEADLFICEGMYGEKEKAEKARQYKHMTIYEAAELARRAQAKELWLTHYSPSLIRVEPYMDEVKKIFSHAMPGRDGKTRILDFEKE